jgi:hypothetical protein
MWRVGTAHHKKFSALFQHRFGKVTGKEIHMLFSRLAHKYSLSLAIFLEVISKPQFL